MAGVYKLAISQSAEELKSLLSQQKTVRGRERVQLLYLLKTKQAETVQAAAAMLGRNRVTVQDWLRTYREGGIDSLVQQKSGGGRPRQIPEWAVTSLQKRLQTEEGFDSYEAIREWLEQTLGVTAAYKTVHKLVHYRLHGSPKVARPRSAALSEVRLDNFKKKLAEDLAMLVWFSLSVLAWGGGIRFFCGDETRLGLKTIVGRKITARGVKPIGKVQWKFAATYIYGMIEPKSGQSFFFEFSHLNSACFHMFLDLVSQQFAGDLLIIQLDNGAFHKAKRFTVPDNIILLFQPPHCPESNPIEQVWQYLKKRLRWQLPKNLEQLRQLFNCELAQLPCAVIASIAGRAYILDALSVAGI
jgi:transposase